MSATRGSWKPGQSGNPNGRPRKAPTASQASPGASPPTEAPPSPVAPPASLPEAQRVATVAEILPPAEVLSTSLVRKTLEADAQVQKRRELAALKPYTVPRGYAGQFRPGSTGNPQGRPPSFVSYIRKMTADGLEMVEHAMLCMRGSVIVRWQDEASGEMRERLVPADPRFQAEARNYLTERGMITAIRAEQTFEGQEPDYGLLTVEECRTLLALNEKAMRPPTAVPHELPSDAPETDDDDL